MSALLWMTIGKRLGFHFKNYVKYDMLFDLQILGMCDSVAFPCCNSSCHGGD